MNAPERIWITLLQKTRERNEDAGWRDHEIAPFLVPYRREREECVWRRDEPGSVWWTSDCNPVFVEFDPVTSEMDRWKACPYCAGTIRVGEDA